MALTGTVSRWFNRKGYGFINVMNSDSEHVGQDVFVHLSGINVKNDGYKCLYPGEYVSFDLDQNEQGQLVCANVTGVMGGPLLVEHEMFRFKYFQKNRGNRDDRVESGEGEESTQTEPEPEPEQQEPEPEQ
uniref:CSD domain-containing protein n=1 Tax=viral metagenome TaxID=1070528 RepID=A0A6C0FBM9_9ZZZZ|tara:strand:+ start:92 stop:484 length:393 start_codon:yes stop_codon:yes gene_type:complete